MTVVTVQFVFHHAPGARKLRFVRKMPLLKGLSDNALLDVAGHMSEEQFEVLPSPSSNLFRRLNIYLCWHGVIANSKINFLRTDTVINQENCRFGQTRAHC